MTWFRVGGAGIPATLKNAMNAVFNKKFGTSGQNYPPKQWPDDVNLLGPLPEGTATGSIANLSDGADDVPTKNVIATIAPTLTGVSSVNVTKTGRNILDFTVRSQYGITTTKGTDGGAIISGTASGGNVFVIDFVAMDLEAGKYNILVSGMSTGMTASWTKNGSYGGALNEGANVITLSAKTKIGGYVRVTNGSSYPDPVTVYVQLTIGQDSETFEKYAPTVYEALLGRTIYGGTADFVNGTGTEKNSAPLTFDGSEDWRADTTRNGVYLLFSTMGTQNFGDGICNMFTTIKTGSGLNSLGICFGVNNYAIYIPHLFDGSIPEVTDVATWQTYLSSHDCTISYPLATQINFTFDGQEINSLYGVNNFWNDAGGDTTVIYRRDIDLALQAVSSSRGLMMASRPITQLIGEESDPDQVNELVEDDEIEQEGEDDAR